MKLRGALIVGLLLLTGARAEDGPWLETLLTAPDTAARAALLDAHPGEYGYGTVRGLSRAAEREAAAAGPRAEHLLTVAHEIARRLDEPAALAYVDHVRGLAAVAAGELPAAAVAFDRAAEAWSRAGAPAFAKTARAWVAWCAASGGQAPRAAAAFADSLDEGSLADSLSARGAGDLRLLEGWARLRQGWLEEDWQRWPDAERHHRAAVDAFAAAEATLPLAVAADRAGLVCYYQSKLDDAAGFYQRSLVAAQALGDPYRLGRAHLGFAEIATDRGDAAAIDAALAAAEAAFRRVDAPIDLARVHWLRGVLLHAQGRHPEVEAPLAAAEALYHEAGRPGGVADVQMLRGINWLFLGDRARAIAALSAAGEVYEQQGNLLGQANVRLKLSHAYRAVGMDDEAASLAERALEGFRAVHDRVGEANSLRALALLASSAGDAAASRQRYGEALEIAVAIEDRLGQAVTHYRLGQLLRDADEDAAVEHLLAARDLYEALADGHGLAMVMLELAELVARHGDGELAYTGFTRALELGEAAGSPTIMAQALFGLGRLAEALQPPHLEAAAELYQAAIDQVEQLRERAGGREAQQGVMATYVRYYEALARVLMRLGRPADAFAVAEHARARTLLDMLVDAGVDSQARLPEAERAARHEKEQALAAASLALARAAGAGADADAVARLRADVDIARAELRLLNDRLASAYPGGASPAEPIGAAAAAELLPADGLLVAFLLGERASYVFALTPDGAVSAAEIAASADDVAALVADYRAACANPRRRYRAAGEALYERLLAPVLGSAAETVKRLVLVPDGALFELPFQALPLGDGFLLDRYRLSYAGSASVLRAARSAAGGREATGELVAFADPQFGELARTLAPGRAEAPAPLPGTAAEADALAAEFGPAATVYRGDAASEATAKKEIERHRYVHFATHGLLDSASPLYSAIVLAEPAPDSGEDGQLEARELLSLTLHADLVALSACDTGRGAAKAGEGLLGLTWALTAAGARSVLASQWQVSDETTPLLMAGFYRRLRAGEDKAAALADAAAELRQTYRHPYHWAPFVLYGSW